MEDVWENSRRDHIRCWQFKKNQQKQNKCPFKNMDYLSSKMELAEPRVNSQYVLHIHKNIILDESVRL